MHLCYRMCVGVRRDIVGGASLLPPCGHQELTQVARFGSWHLYLLRQPVDPGLNETLMKCSNLYLCIH